MRKFLIPAAALIVLSGAPFALAVTPDMVPVGNVGNATNSFGVGAVGYTYQISRTEVTNTQYAEFLNAVDPAGSNALGLYNSNMGNSGLGTYDTGGIDFNVNAAVGSKYAVKPGKSNNPVIWVSWNDAARFVNWMHNGQGSGTTELGAYDMSQASPSRIPGATYVLPTEHEWVKAAHYDPAKLGGAGYWTYATKSDTEPTSDDPPTLADPANSANFQTLDGKYAVTGSSVLNINQNYLTDVGAYVASISAYGTHDQNGNVFEWDESLVGSSRQTRGGSWSHVGFYLNQQNFTPLTPDTESNYIGFRIALVPEPGSTTLLALGLATLCARRRTQHA